MFDASIAQDLTSTMIELAIDYSIDRSKLHASSVFASIPMPTETVNLKLEMLAHTITTENGAASLGVSNTEPIFCDVALTAEPRGTGESFDWNDFKNYKAEEKVRAFVTNAMDFPFYFDEAMFARMLVRGHVDVCTFDGLPYFSNNAARRVIPGRPQAMSNNVDCSLVGTAISAITIAQIRAAIRKVIANIRGIGFAGGLMLDQFKPVQLWCHTQAEQIVLDAVEAEFISTGQGSTDVRAFKAKYPFEIVSSPYIDQAYANNAALGVVNPECVLFMVCAPKGQASGFITGINENFTLLSDLPAITDGQRIRAFSVQLVGKPAYAYMFPHFIHRMY